MLRIMFEVSAAPPAPRSYGVLPMHNVVKAGETFLARAGT